MSMLTSVAAGFARLVQAVNTLAARVQPAGGTVGQVLTKTGAADYAASWQTPSGGGGGGLGAVVTVDFGATAAKEKTFLVTVAGAALGQRVMATPSLDMPAGVAWDELELDPITVSAGVTAADTVRLVVASTRGRIRGQRNISLTLG